MAVDTTVLIQLNPLPIITFLAVPVTMIVQLPALLLGGIEQAVVQILVLLLKFQAILVIMEEAVLTVAATTATLILQSPLFTINLVILVIMAALFPALTPGGQDPVVAQIVNRPIII